MQKALDRAIMLKETAETPALAAGYTVKGKTYESYLSRENWAAFEAEMKTQCPSAFAAYGVGGGKEMEERRVGKYIYPPKMASFGSSSRMIYNLMKGNAAFQYEKKLSTTVGGVANLDGFAETEERCVFVEAKCREPYGVKNGNVSQAYGELYEFLTRSQNNNLTCDVTGEGVMRVRFFAGERELLHFDLKQMICHLLGVATAYLQGEYDKAIDFIYLLYNPTQLPLEETYREDIFRVYQSECEECLSVNFYDLFYDILRFLQEIKGVGKEQDVRKIAALFSFRMCDQDTMAV